MDIDGAIEPITERYLSRVIGKAESREAEALIIRIDTPGGLISSMRNIAEQLLNSPVPTVAYVWPSGAQAASAGTIVTIAAHIAAMAPATNIGAAAPVTGTGEDLPPTLRKKVDEDITALIRSIAQLRERNYDAIERTVLEAKAYTADEALELNVIDHIAVDLDSLLNQIDGEVVETPAGRFTLRTAGAQVDEFGRSLLERFLDILTNPNVTYALVLLGTLRRALRDPRSGQLRSRRFGRARFGAGLLRHRTAARQLDRRRAVGGGDSAAPARVAARRLRLGRDRRSDLLDSGRLSLIRRNLSRTDRAR